MDVYTKNREQIVLEESPLSSGGEGEVRKVMSAPRLFPSNSCVKIYYKNKRSQQQQKKIAYMVENPPTKVQGPGFMLGWPLASVFDRDSEFIGFLMPLAFPESKELINLTTINLNKKLSPEWFQKYDRKNGKYALLSRLKLINNISIPIHLLHSTNKYVLKDFKPQNVLVTHKGQVTLVDMDSVQISNGEKLLFPGTAATDMYIPIEYYKQGVGKNNTVPLQQSWDNFALGVVFYQLLFGLHPYVVTPWNLKDDSTNEISVNIANGLFPFGPNTEKIRSYPEPHKKFNVLPDQIKELFLNAFSDNPYNRPSALKWGKTVHDTLKTAPKVSAPKMPKDQTSSKPNSHKTAPKVPTPKIPKGQTSSETNSHTPNEPIPQKPLWRKVVAVILYIVAVILFTVILLSILDCYVW